MKLRVLVVNNLGQELPRIMIFDQLSSKRGRIGVNLVSRLTKGFYTTICAAQRSLATKTILQIAGSAGLNLEWKAARSNCKH